MIDKSREGVTDRVDDGGAQQEQNQPLREGHGHISSRGGLKPPDPRASQEARALRCGSVLSSEHPGPGLTWFLVV